MSKRILIVLALTAMLMVPAFGQQDNSTAQPAQDQTAAPTQPTQNQPAQAQPAQAQTTQTQASDQSGQPHQPLTLEQHEGFWGKLNPFARKKYVRRQLEPITARVNELDELTAANAKMIKDVDSRAQEGIRMASNKANEADMHAVQAGQQAQTANQTAQQADSHAQQLNTVITSLDQYKPVTQAEIRFRPGQSALSKKAKDALDEMAEQAKQNGYIVQVQGFSSGQGQTAIANSQAMAQAVVRYLVISHDIPVWKIYTVGLGNAPMTTAQGEKPRRVRGGRLEVSLLKNPVADLQTNATMQQPAGATQEQMNAAPAGQGGTSGTTTQPAPATTTPAPSNTQGPASNVGAQPQQQPTTTQPPQQQPPDQNVPK